MIANVAIVDLDADGLADIVAADATTNRITWVRQAPAGRFTERSSPRSPGRLTCMPSTSTPTATSTWPWRASACSSPTTRASAPSCCSRTTARERFTPHVVLRDVPRVADVRAGDLDGDGDLDLSVALSATTRARRAGSRTPAAGASRATRCRSSPARSTPKLPTSTATAISTSSRWSARSGRRSTSTSTTGAGQFTPPRIFGASNEDFGSSWISLADLDGDGDADVVYSNGDAFDYATTAGRSWNGVQWLENTGGVAFTYHRIADVPGASSPQAADLDGDGDLDIAVVSAYNNWAEPAAQSLVWLENDGRARFTLRDLASAPTHLVTLAVGDLTGDGRPDLVTGGMHMSWPYDRLSRLTLWTNQWSARAR